MRRERRVAPGHLDVAFEHLVDVRVRHALGGADDAGSHARGFHAAGRIEFHQRAHHQAIFARFQRAHSVRKSFRKHGHGAVRKIDGGPAQSRFLIKCAAGSDVMRDIRNMDLQTPAAVSPVFDVDGVVKIACRLAVDGDNGQMAKILAPFPFRLTHRLCAKLRFVQDFSGKGMGQVVLANDDFDVNAEFTRPAKDFNHAACGRSASARITYQLDVHHGAVKLVQARNASSPDANFIGAAESQFLPKTGCQLLAARNLHFVLDSSVIGQDRVPLRTVTK